MMKALMKALTRTTVFWMVTLPTMMAMMTLGSIIFFPMKKKMTRMMAAKTMAGSDPRTTSCLFGNSRAHVKGFGLLRSHASSEKMFLVVVAGSRSKNLENIINRTGLDPYQGLIRTMRPLRRTVKPSRS
jgi:hypothetical protein